MPKPHAFPYLFDEVKSISICDLKKWNYLKNGYKTGTITWSRNGIETSSIGIGVFMVDGCNYLELDYKCNGSSYNYKVELISLPSNLGKGKVWYFLCTFTGKRCRKLHLIHGNFMHRSALPNGMYTKQTHSKKWRYLEKTYSCYFDSEKNYRELKSKHFKNFYNGKPTKRFKKLMDQIHRYEKLTVNDIERMFLI